MKFVLDENLSPLLAMILDLFDRKNEVRSLLDHFQSGTKDIVWIQSIGTWDEKPVIVSIDKGILANEVEKRMLKESNLAYVLLTRGWQLEWNVMVYKLIQVWPKIVQEVSHAREKCLFRVTPMLKVEKFIEINKL